jgi:hypothetical protein
MATPRANSYAVASGGTVYAGTPAPSAVGRIMSAIASLVSGGASGSFGSSAPSRTFALEAGLVAGSASAGDPPTLAALWADIERTTTSEPLDVSVALDKPAQVAYEIEFYEEGVSRGTVDVPVGAVGAVAPVSLATQGERQLDFEIRLAGGGASGLTRLRRPLAITVHDTAARLVTEFSDVAFAGKWDVFYIRNLGNTATTFSVSGTSSATFSPASGTIPAGAKIPIGFKVPSAGSTDITVTSPAPIIGATKTVTVSSYTTPTVPTPASSDYEIVTKPIATYDWLIFERWFNESLGGAAYDRWCKPLLISPAANTIQFTKYRHDAGAQAFSAGEVFELRMWERPPTFAGRIDMSSLGAGTLISTRTVPTAGSRFESFTVDIAGLGLTEGWKLIDIVPASGGFVGVPFWVYVMLGSVPVDQDTVPWLPVAAHSFDNHTFGQVGPFNFGKWISDVYQHHVGRVPNRTTGLVSPMARRETPHFQDTPNDRTQFVCETLTGSPGWPNQLRTVVESGPSSEMPIGAGGLLRHTFNEEYYFKSKFFRANPLYATTDGERGVNHTWAPTVINGGLALPGNTGFRGNLYVCESHRWVKIDRTGKVTTLAGYKHTHPPRRWTSNDTADISVAAQNYTLVGDWSAIPSERWGFHEMWAQVWDGRTLPINTAATTIPTEENQQPHVLPVVAYLTDTQNNRVLKAEFVDSAATSSNPRHGGTVRITEFITGMSDPWGMEQIGDKLYITERLAHRISIWSADTPNTFLGVLCSGAALSTVGVDRQPSRLASLAAIQAEDIVGPEGLVKFVDEAGDLYLIFGSWAMNQIRRVKVSTGEVSVCVSDLLTDNNALWVHLAISDGTFGPRGTLFSNTWSAANASGSAAFPEAWKYNGSLSWSRWQYYSGTEYTESGMPWPSTSLGYPTASGVVDGKLIFGGAGKGLRVLSRKLASDTVVSNFQTGRTKYIRMGFDLTHGGGGWSDTGLAPPFGVDTDIDAYLEAHGHVPP